MTITKDLADAANKGKTVKLIVGLNVATSPQALTAIHGLPNLAIRYFTHRFHAKIYLFDNAALLGSSNLTEGGMLSNREATLILEDLDSLNDLRSLFEELWLSAPVLTKEKLQQFVAVAGNFGQMFNPDIRIENAVGKAEPANIKVGTERKSAEFLFLEGLHHRVDEQFRPAFNETAEILKSANLRRDEWTSTDSGSETNRFLNWVRLEHAPGDEWQSVATQSTADRKNRILAMGAEWVATDKPRIADYYFDMLANARDTFGSLENIDAASADQLSDALMGIHAFYEQIRFVKGGRASLPEFFWNANDKDITRVKKTLKHLLFGKDDFNPATL